MGLVCGEQGTFDKPYHVSATILLIRDGFNHRPQGVTANFDNVPIIDQKTQGLSLLEGSLSKLVLSL